jgi:hypothetical protein
VSLIDTFKTYNPVTLAVGCLFVLCGSWTVFEVIMHGVRTSAGGIFIFVMFVLLPVSLGVAIIHNQLRLRRNSN